MGSAPHRPPKPARGKTRSFVGTNPPTGARLHYSLGKKVAKASIEIRSMDGKLLRTLEAKGDAGIHEVVWDLRAAPQPKRRFGRRMGAGTYKAVLVIGERTWAQAVVIEKDPNQPDAGWMTFQDEADEAAAAKAAGRIHRHLPQHVGRDE